MNEDMSLNESVSGISRSGRVRKKSAKLMEMEDHHGPALCESEHGTEVQHQQQQQQQQQRKGIKKSSAGGGGKTQISVAQNDGRVVHHQTSSSSFSSKTEQRVIAIKQVDPPATFEALSGSAYLIGDDVHFITGEPIDSEGEEAVDGGGGYLSPLKIDVSGSVDITSLHDESGLKMKFILSPKPPTKSESKSGHSKKKSSEKAGLKRSSSGGGNKSKKKKKQESPESVMPVLEALAAGGIPNPAFGLDSDSDDLGESRLIIAEPPVLQPMVAIGKTKKKSASGGGGGNGHHKSGGLSKPKKKKKSGSSKSSKHDGEPEMMNNEGVGQQQSLYLKEKNTSKKKASKKAAKAKDKMGVKVRPASAYMLWCRENRTRIVSENPGMDFSAISRRLGEDWQSLSEFEKMNWRRKAKAQGSVKSSNVIKTGKKPSESSLEKGTGGKFVAKHSSGAFKSEDVSTLCKEIHRAVGTTPLDVAAHLKLLGESLSIIGQRLTEHMGQIAVSGSLSVLLDSTLCALAPLICLTSEVDQLNGCPKPTQERILDHIAYVMPGL